MILIVSTLGANERHITLSVESKDTIKAIKAKIKQEEDIPLDQQILFEGGRQLKDECTLFDYLIEDEDIIYLVVKAGSGQPKVTVDPHSQSVEATHTVTFTAIVDGVGEENYYQWRHNGGFINGETSNTLTINSVTEDDVGKYDCLVNNEFEDCVISEPSELKMKPTITAHPSSVAVTISNENESVSLTCEAERAMSYHWEKEDGSGIPSDAIGVDSNTLTLVNLTPFHAGNYRCVVGSESDSNFTDYATITINVEAPKFTMQPSFQTAHLTQNAAFSCSATGYNVNYQWTIGSGSFPSKVTGVNTNTLVIPDVRSSDGDNTYTCTISNDGGSVTSDPAQLTVTGLPVVTVDPPSQSVEVTQTVKFTATVSGVGKENFTYQWKHSGEGVNGETSNSLTIVSVTEDHSGTYECVVINEYGVCVTSKAAELKIRPAITAHPNSVAITISNENESLSLTCEAEGATSYCWKKKGGSIPSGATGVDSNTLTLVNVKPMDTGSYRCVVGNKSDSNFSDYATVTVNVEAPKFTMQPSFQTAHLTQNAAFLCSATGYNVNYQWTIGSGSFPSKVTGINTNTLVIPDVKSSDDNSTYTCKISNDGGSVTSDPAQLTVNGLPVVTVDPPSQSVEVTQTVKFTATVSGVGKENFTYQWRHNKEDINGETSDTLTIVSVTEDHSGTYECVVVNEFGDCVTSTAELKRRPTITTHPKSEVVTISNENECLSLTCEAEGAISYCWERQGGSIPSGATGVDSNTLTFNLTPFHAGNYRCVVGSKSDNNFTDYATITINVEAPKFSVQLSSQNVYLMQTARFTCSATGYNVNYQWTIGSGSFPSKVTSINTNTLVIPDVRSSDDNSTYTCTISNDGGSVTSDPAQLTVTGLPVVTVDPPSQSVEVTQTVKFTATVSGVGKENFTYQWRHSGEDINGETSDTLTIFSVTEDHSGTYECVAKNEYGDYGEFNAKLIVTNRAVAKTLPAEAFIDYQDELLQKLPMNDAVFVALLKKNNFFSGNQKAAMQAQCTEVEKAQYFLDDIVGHDIDVLFVKLLSVMEVYGEPITTLAGKIKERIGLISCSRIEEAMAGASLAEALKEYQVRLVSSLPMDDLIFVAMLEKSNFFVGNHKATMQAKQTKVDKASYFLDYIVERHVDVYFIRLLNVMEVFGGNGQSLAREIKENLGISVPNVTVDPPSQSVEVTHTVKFTATVSGVGKENFTYQWRHNKEDINGETSDTLTIVSVTEDHSGTYECVVKNEFGDCVTSNTSELRTKPTIIAHPHSETVPLASNNECLSLACEAEGATSYCWEKEDGSSIPSDAIGVNSNTLTLVNLTPFHAGNYRCVVGCECDSNISNYATIAINVGTPKFSAQPSSQTVCLTQTATFICSATGYNVNYQWTIGSGSFPSKVTGINTNILVISDVKSSDDSTYTCTISNGGGSATSDPAQLTVTGLPVVTVDPPSQSVEVTQTVKFTTTVSGVGKENFTYQWRHNKEDINGETSNTLTIVSVTEDHSGTYECVVKNECGDCVTSNTSELRTKPTIIAHPNSETVSISSDDECLSLACEAEGATSYYWERQDGSVPSDVTGQNTHTLTLVNLTPAHSGSYRCVVKNNSGKNFTNYAIITINVVFIIRRYLLKHTRK
ncbi:basement membrane-specific heparan sulfate proteoglycan core protein-like isoform X3 [Dysidea avara]|uniref:basement membrane-specific heparan sulfate proteoglycan core protein-like isoform X3 n=1 Tax=Dysidea avara TaxID=196820 RepID=UPI003319F802